MPVSVFVSIHLRMARVVHIIDSHGQPGRLKLKNVRQHEAEGLGEWQDGVFIYKRFTEKQLSGVSSVSASPTTTPNIGRIVSCRVDHFDGCDSGFSLLRYPMRSGGAGPQYPALARLGAGL